MNSTISYIVEELWLLVLQNQDTMLLLLPLFLAIEVPLSMLTLTGIMRWFLRQNKNNIELLQQCPKVSCIITCYSEGEAIQKTIFSLQEQIYSGKMEIIAVVDGAAANNTTYQAANDCLQFFSEDESRQLVILPKWQRGGRVSTLNAGLAKSSGEIVINVDGDTSFDNDMVQEVVKHFNDPAVPALGAALRVRNHSKNLLTRMQAIEYMVSMQANKTGLAEWNLLNNISGAFGAFRRNFLRTIGGWDTHTAEDLDLTVRIKHYFSRHTEFRIPFAPHAIGHTDVPETIIGLLQQRLRWDGDLLFLYLRKHSGSLTPKLLGFKTFVFTLLFGVVQNIFLPLLVVGFGYWMLFQYPIEFTSAIFILIYFVYLCMTLVHFLVFLIGISEQPGKDLKFMIWMPVFPFYTLIIRLWCVVALLNEIFRRGHEESSMAPWWVMRRGNRF